MTKTSNKPWFRRSFLQLLLVVTLCFLASNTNAREDIDIGVVAGCIRNKFISFRDRIELTRNPKRRKQVRFLVIRYQCADPSEELPLESNSLANFPMVVADSTENKFTRSSNINQLYKLVRPGARLLVVDIDIHMKMELLKNVIKYTSPGHTYFPIMWSLYSPRHIAVIEEQSGQKVLPYSNWEGQWRVYSFGMFAMHARDLPRFPLNESFVGWGGEDLEFHARVRGSRSMQVVRKRERGLIHVWHEKNCSSIVEDPKQKFSCLGSKAAYLGYVTPS